MKKSKKILAAMTAAVLLCSSLTAGLADGEQAVPVSFADIPGILVGNWTDYDHGTGCTVIVVDDAAGGVAGVDVRGGSPGTRETDLLDPTKEVQIANAICLGGGSAFGLDAAGGVQQFLEEKGYGVNVGPTVVPIVPSAILFDLGYITHTVRPGKAEGYAATKAAFDRAPWSDGCTGAGTGATVGKGVSGTSGMKGGLGSFAYKMGDLYVGAIVAVNAAGNVVDPVSGEIVAGSYDAAKNLLVDKEAALMNNPDAYVPLSSAENTTIGCIVTNAKLNQAQVNKLAEATHDGFARAIYPTHTPSDGDTIFAVAYGNVDTQAKTWDMQTPNLNLISVLAVNAMERAIVSACANAKTLPGAPDIVGAASLDKTPIQPLTVKSSALEEVKKTPAVSTGGSTAAEQPAGGLSADGRTYTVQEGETLSTIAAKCGVPYMTLAELNHITNPKSVRAGQKIRLPA